METPDQYSGELIYSEGVLIYSSKLSNWSVPITSIRLIGEYTNSDGPFMDDYFFVFLTAVENGWNEASFYAKGRSAAIDSVGEQLGSRIEAGLCDSTEFKTRILWPSHLHGQELMEAVSSKNESLWRKLTGTKDITLSAAARKAFG